MNASSRLMAPLPTTLAIQHTVEDAVKELFIACMSIDQKPQLWLLQWNIPEADQQLDCMQV
jgi:hypothetical protein